MFTRILDTNNWITTVNYYDDHKRVVYTYSKNNYLNTTDIIEYKLDDFTGQVLETRTSHKIGNDETIIVEAFQYDHSGRLLTQSHKIDAQNEETLFSNTFDALGQLTRKRVGVDNITSNELQVVDFSYNIRGWLKEINKVNNLGTDDLFAFEINYNNPSTGTALFNGNISQTKWRTANTDSSLKTYTYSYDSMNRILSASDNTGNYDVSNITYDKMGNIQSLTRDGFQNGSFPNMDVLQYEYDTGNKLLKVKDNGNATYGFKDLVDQDTVYTYDANGNMITDANKGITAITYNHLNLPTQISFGGSDKIEYIYDATGIKLQKKVTKDSNVTTTDYSGSYVYQEGDLQFIFTPEGYATPNGSTFDYVYHYKDHLGNIRLSYSDANNNGTIEVTSDPLTTEIIEEHNYYPFGLKHKGYNSDINGTHHKYMFGGKEYQDDVVGGSSLDWYDVTARNYDPALGRWMNLDPLAEQMRRHSPYNYAFDNPIYWTDPDGMAPGPGDWIKGKINQVKTAARREVVRRVKAAAKTVVKNVSTKVNSLKSSISAALTPTYGITIWGSSSGGYGIGGNGAKKSAGSIDASQIPSVSALSGKGALRVVGYSIQNFKNGEKIGEAINKSMSNNNGTVETTNNSGTDTTFVTTKAGSIETEVVSSNQVTSFGNVEKVEVTVPKSKVDSVNNASQQSLDKQLQQMNEANEKLLNSLRN